MLHGTSSLLFELELEPELEELLEDGDGGERDQGGISPSPSSQAALLRLLSSSREGELKAVWLAAERAHAAAARRASGEVDLQEFARRLAAGWPHAVWVRSGCAEHCNGRRHSQRVEAQHQFVITHAAAGMLVVIDPCFWQQFHVGVRTSSSEPKFRQLLPPVCREGLFVGNAELISAAVGLLCVQVDLEFSRLGHPTPPWRSKKSMLRRWLVKRADDIEVESVGA
ncbi:hypothetical protein FOA52_012501 [Chlamydomonas sp. UWO 241]|nr:hypothetical protein FOA52_012501 [Chlamydomonas sp. UWO 241]